MTLRLPDSGAEITPDGRRIAPSAERNAAPILALLQAELPKTGRLLEIASGTGQHAATFAPALPGIEWQPTDVNPDNLASITAWRAFSGTANLHAPLVLDAAAQGWSAAHGKWDAILIVNLLHLISTPAAATVLRESAASLQAGGMLLIYGPFLRDGQPTSDGDARFDASLRADNPANGYKDLRWVTDQLAVAGLSQHAQTMPANNLMLVAKVR